MSPRKRRIGHPRR